MIVTAVQKQLVQDSFARIASSADDVAALFYQRLFDLDPMLRLRFHGDMAAQRTRLAQTITVMVKGLDDLDRLLPELQELGRRYAATEIIDRYYAIIRRALLWTLEKGLGDAFTPELRRAWAAVYTLVATTMQEATCGAAVCDRSRSTASR